MKKAYIKPLYKVYPVRHATVICGSLESINAGVEGDGPTAVDGEIVTETKSSSVWDNEW